MILVFGDVHGDFRHVVEAVDRHAPAAIILLGDLEPQRPLEVELAAVMGRTEVWFIHGNHETDQPHTCRNVFDSALAGRNLHGRVVEIDGLRVAGLGGVFREDIWHPGVNGGQPAFASYADYAADLEFRWEISRAQGRQADIDSVFEGKLRKHRSSIFYADYAQLFEQQADVLVSHEAPSCHPHGFEWVDELGQVMGIHTAFHGHHHDCLDYSAATATLGFRAFGVGFRGISDIDGKVIRPGTMDAERCAGRQGKP